MKITALLTGNRRDTNTGVPKALLINVTGFGRDHMWVELTPQLEKLQPAGHKKPIRVAIDGETRVYRKRGIAEAMTLAITNIHKL